MLSLGLSITSPAVWGRRSYDADAQAIFDAFTTPATVSRKILINDLVLALKAATIWDDLDILYVIAAEDSQAARINWKNPGVFTASPVNAPTFEVDRGYTGDGSSARLNTNWTPSVNAVNYSQNSASIWVWCRNNIAATTVAIGSRSVDPVDIIYPRTAGGNFSTYVNINNSDTATIAFGIGTSVGFSGAQRRGAADARTWKDGIEKASSSTASVGLPTQEQWICGGNATQFSTLQQSVAAWGASLAGKELAFYNATLAYLQAVGAA
jgi:hypothetical protein